MKVSIVYHSVSGNTKKMAEFMADKMNSFENLEVKAFSIDNVDEEWIKESKGVIVGTPTYMADMSDAMKKWLSYSALKYNLSGKLGGAFATADYIYGGGTLAIQNILGYMLILSMLTYSGGAMFGVPVIHLGPVAIKDKLEESYDTFEIFAQRMANKLLEIF